MTAPLEDEPLRPSAYDLYYMVPLSVISVLRVTLRP
jgi:hypothetical protein